MTILHEACQRGDLDFVRNFLSRPDADVNARDAEEGLTPLLAATEHLPMVQFLCQQGANVMPTDNFGRTFLHIATYRGHAPVIEWLLEGYKQQQHPGDDSSSSHNKSCRRNPWAECIDQANETALHYAAYRGNLQIAHYLIELGQVDILARNRLGKTALTLARQAEELPLVSYLNSLILLSNACKCQENDLLKRLLQAGVFAKFRFGRNGDQLIHGVCQDGNLEGARILHKYGDKVDWDIPSGSGKTPLHYAARMGRDQVVRWLCEQGVAVDRPCPVGSSALVISVLVGHVDVAKVLLQFGADVNYRDSSGVTPIHQFSWLVRKDAYLWSVFCWTMERPCNGIVEDGYPFIQRVVLDI
mmetsp:Transcript_17500/g.35213  ORF Transcript_17500/g.35213 Transcript_17500/m.35213 type:complete len:358 (+) Transcript_17500:108-1181(+)